MSYSAKPFVPQVPYFFIKDLRERNKALHVKDGSFMEKRQANNYAPQR